MWECEVSWARLGDGFVSVAEVSVLEKRYAKTLKP